MKAELGRETAWANEVKFLQNLPQSSIDPSNLDSESSALPEDHHQSIWCHLIAKVSDHGSPFSSIICTLYAVQFSPFNNFSCPHISRCSFGLTPSQPFPLAKAVDIHAL